MGLSETFFSDQKVPEEVGWTLIWILTIGNKQCGLGEALKDCLRRSLLGGCADDMAYSIMVTSILLGF